VALISDDDQRKLNSIVTSVTGAYAIYLIGRDLGHANPMLAARVADQLSISSLAGLDLTQQAYIAGKIAGSVGLGEFAKMGYPDLERWVSINSVILSTADLAAIANKQQATERFIDRNLSNWTKSVGLALTEADTAWLAAVARGDEDLSALTDDRTDLPGDLFDGDSLACSVGNRLQ
jgi:hypothetical protein